jgi:two-component system osmolarity sensor histidine kinase EnvZ
MALLSTAVLLAIQAGWFVLVVMQPPHHEVDGFARGILLMLQAANGEPVQGADLAPAMRVHLVPTWNMPSTIHLHTPGERQFVELSQHLRERLPRGTQIEVDDARPPRLWIRYPGKSTWVVVPVDIPPRPRFIIETVSMLVAALILSLLAVWQMQRPLSRVALAARAFGAGGRPEPVNVQGPRELRDLIGSFNDMMRRLNEAGDDQAVMLAGVAHDLKAPLTRLKLRASVLVAENERAGLIRDVDSLTNIVQPMPDRQSKWTRSCANSFPTPLSPIPPSPVTSPSPVTLRTWPRPTSPAPRSSASICARVRTSRCRARCSTGW